ncbi:MAG: efflux RND transporter periplasmic adaptor subunit [Sedimentisphaerales bacterium]|nr:efflux RND transporter periplasmic adaptor subunit [Sedimentisphaerales bacterium]
MKVMEVVAISELADTFTLPAVIEPNRVVTVSAEVAARVETIPPQEGDPVGPGDLLIQLNKDLIEPAFHTAEAQYRRDQVELERMEALVRDNATSRQDLDDAVAKLAASKAALEEAQARLERTRIEAPAGGVLNELLVEEGEYVQPGTAVAEVVEMDPVKVRVDVPERDIAFFRVGGTAEILVGVRDERPLTGTITYINELADRQTRSTPMEITLDNPDGLLRSGQIVRAQLTRRVIENAIMIPLLAVIPMENGYAVYVANDTQAERLDVKIDMVKGDRVRILEGLQDGQKLIVAGHRFLTPGQQVNVVSEN